MITQPNDFFYEEVPPFSNLQGVDLAEMAKRFHRRELQRPEVKWHDHPPRNFWLTYFRRHDFSGMNLSRTNFYRAHLVGCNFDGAKLHGAKMECANLNECNFEGADLRGAVCNFASFWRANLAGARLGGARFEGSKFDHAIAPDVDFRWAYLVCADFACADLRGANFEGSDLRSTGFADADLSGANLSRTKIEGSRIRAGRIDGACLSGMERDLKAPPRGNARVPQAIQQSIRSGGSSVSIQVSRSDLMTLVLASEDWEWNQSRTTATASGEAPKGKWRVVATYDPAIPEKRLEDLSRYD